MSWVRLAALCLLFVAAAGPTRAGGLAGFVSPGELASAHAELDTLAGCPDCHQPGKGVSADRCLACHVRIAGQIEAGRGYHAELGERCERCHSDHRGRDHPMVELPDPFNHQQTGFALHGAHAPLACEQCHVEAPDWTGLDGRCDSCHEEPHGAAESLRPLLTQCRLCHDAVDWTALPVPERAAFSHDDPEDSDYALHGEHAGVDCRACHEATRFVPTPADECTDCHFDVHDGQFAGRRCEACHDQFTPGFRLPGFDHAATPWPLRGEHADVPCLTCHGAGPDATWRPVEHDDCDACHGDPHVARFEPDDCSDCHPDGSWTSIPIDHDRTRYPLRGAHAEAPCGACHGDGPARWLAPLAFDSCLDCHAHQDPHEGLLSPWGCPGCHAVQAWADVSFDHDTTPFPLLGAHAGAACAACHDDPAYRGAKSRCDSCHEGARPPDHFAGACDDCHDATAWLPATLGLTGHAITGFPLEGEHRRLACADCHAPDEARGAIGPECVDCHAVADPHRNQHGDDCAECHRLNDWLRTTFRHALTGWPLRGDHAAAACDDCHVATYAGTPTECGACHGGSR